MIVGKSENDRPVAPGPPWNSVSPLNSDSGVGVVQADGAGRVARGVQYDELMTTTSETLAGSRAIAVGHVPVVYDVPEHRVVRMQPDRRIDERSQVERRVDVVVVAVSQHDGRPLDDHRRPPRSPRRRGLRRSTTTSWASPTSQTLLSTSQVPPSRLNVPCVTTRSMGSGPSEDDDGTQDLAALHLVERLLDVLEGDGLADELVERQSTLQVQVDEHREVAARQAVAVPGGLERPTTTEDLDERRRPRHRRVGHADEDGRAGQVA